MYLVERNVSDWDNGKEGCLCVSWGRTRKAKRGISHEQTALANPEDLKKIFRFDAQ